MVVFGVHKQLLVSLFAVLTCSTKTTFPNARRKRLFWTLEEEDMLKV